MNLVTRGLGRSSTQYSALVAAGLGSWPAGSPVAPAPSPSSSGAVGFVGGGRSLNRDPLRIDLPGLPAGARIDGPRVAQHAYLPALAHVALGAPVLRHQIVMPAVQAVAAPEGLTLQFSPPPWLLDD